MTDEVRAAMSELLAAERRLRGRDPHRPGDLSATQVRALFQLERGEACTAGELAKRADLSPASMTAMLDQLVQSGIVERRRSEQDRRQVIVSLTDAGHETLAAKRADLSPASMTAMLDQLVQSGIVERRRSEQDRRQVIVSLTDAGHETLAAKREAIEARTKALLSGYTDGELDAASRVMRSLAELLDGLGK